MSILNRFFVFAIIKIMKTLEKSQEKGNLMQVKDKIVIITGGTRGIGKSIAEAFALAGADLIITGRSASSNVPEEIKTANENPDLKISYMSCDLSQKTDIQNLIDSVLAQKGRIDVLINNAGITKDTLFMRMKEEEWNAVIDTNLNSLFYICQPVIKAMSKQRSGSIINMTSVVGLHGNPAQVNYASSKAGMIGFTKALAKEYGRRGIRVNAIAPGFISTEMTAELPEEVQNKYKENIPLGDFGNTKDIADTALFLAGSANYITGQVIQVDGGLFM
jgi:3-oxoacyl-[acyl-carrier protein] reductase